MAEYQALGADLVERSWSPAPSSLLFTQGANGIRYSYRSFGSGDPLVLLAWFRANLDMWDTRLIASLATYRRVIVVDNAGVGFSGGALACTVEGMAAHVCAFVDALGLSEIDLLGFSLGGFVARQVVLDRPSLVRHLILVGTAPRATGLDLALRDERARTVIMNNNIGRNDLFVLVFRSRSARTAKGP